MEQGRVLPDFIKYVSMNVLGMLGLSCYILADTWFIAKGLGADGLAALNLALPVYSFIQGGGLMLGMGAAAKYSILRGGGRDAQARTIFTKALAYTAGLAAVFFLLGLFAAPGLTALMGAEGAVFPMTETYLRFILLFAPAFLANDLLLCFVRNDGGPQLAMAAMVGGSLSNIVLDYVFIFPCDMGIFGAVLATGLAPLVSLAILSVWFLGRRNTFGLTRTRPDLRTAGEVCSLGLPSLIAEVSAGTVMLAFNLLILALEGSVGVAAYGVVANLSLVLMAIFTGVGQGIQPLASRYCGAGRPERGRKVYRYALALALAGALVFYALIFLFAGPAAAAFNGEGNAQLQRIAREGLRLYFTALPFAAFNVITALYCSATDRPRPAFALSMLRGFGLILPLALVLSRLWGMTGVWLAFPAAEGAAAVVCLLARWNKDEKNPPYNFQKNVL